MPINNIPNPAEMCSIARYCAGNATRQERNIVISPSNAMEYIVDFFTFGDVKKEKAGVYDTFAKAMTSAILHRESPPNTIPQRLPVDCFGYTVIFTQPGEHHNPMGPVTIEICKSGNTVSTEVNKKQFCHISLALLLRHKGKLPATSVVLTDEACMDLRGATLYRGKLALLDLSNAELRCADLRWANLQGTNLSGTNLSEADLLMAELKGANLDGANLSGANLKYADLRGASLQRAIMGGVKLDHARLNEVNLSGAMLKGVDLRTAQLKGANLDGANLSGANLSKADLMKTNLSYADLRKANLGGAHLIETNLKGAILSGVCLTGVIFGETDMSEADLSDVNLNWNYLGRVKLRGAKLSRSNLSMTGLENVDLSNVILDKTNLSFSHLDGANLSGASLCAVELNGAVLKGVNLTDIQDSGTLLWLPKWSRTTLDTYLNHINNCDSGNLLTMMDSIDEQYADVKLRMAHELMTSLKKAGVNLSDVALPLMGILSKPPYTDDAEINTWLGNLCERYLSRYNGQVLPENEGALNQSIALFSRRPELMSSHNGTFIQIIAQAMKEKSTSAMKTTAAAQYEAYLQLALVKPYCSLADFGDGEGKPDWADKDAINFILLSAQPATVSVMLLSQASLESMLRPRSDTVWNNIYLYRAQNCLSLAQSPGGYNLFTKVFTLFNAPYQYMQKNAKFLLLVKTLNLGSLENTFVFATKVSSSSTKLVSAASQIALGYIFTPKLTHSTGSKHCGLNAAHYEELVSAYELTSASAADKGKTLLCLAALFTKYSSSAIFGTETESPEALRHYAYALMAKAHSLDESLLKRATFTDWTNRLLGLNKAFTCTAVLSYDMVEHIRSRFPATLAGIMPPAWS